METVLIFKLNKPSDGPFVLVTDKVIIPWARIAFIEEGVEGSKIELDKGGSVLIPYTIDQIMKAMIQCYEEKP